jgi:hypothetical protein
MNLKRLIGLNPVIFCTSENSHVLTFYIISEILILDNEVKYTSKDFSTIVLFFFIYDLFLCRVTFYQNWYMRHGTLVYRPMQ